MNGAMGERVIEAMLRLKGFRILGRHVTARTTQGIRYIDYVVEKGGEYIAVEVKTGNGIRSTEQLAKDYAMQTEGAKLTNNVSPEIEGKTLKLATEEMRPF